MMDKGIWKILVILIVLVMVGSCVAVPSAGGVSESEVKSSSATIYVPDGYSTIQEAVNVASAGDTIIVRDGTYIENIEVDKSLTIQSESGPDSTIVQAEDPGDNVFSVTADYVEISGFTVEAATEEAGIYLYNAGHCNISYNKCSNSEYGINLRASNNNQISNNNCSNNGWHGIDLSGSHNIITNNNCSNNDWYGIDLSGSHNIITNNNCSNNDWHGIDLRGSHNIITNNNCSNNGWYGIDLWASNNNIISNNNCSNNDWHGIDLYGSNNTISNNNCSNNRDDGIYLRGSHNSISNNYCSNNRDYGIYLSGSNNNKLKANVMFENGIVIRGYLPSHYEHEIDESNTVNGKPVYYWRNIEGGRVSDGAGQVILVNCMNVTVENQELNNASIGIQIAFSSYITIKNNHCSNNEDGIYLAYSNSTSISNNTCLNNRRIGIYFMYSNNNSISNNKCSNNSCGISLEYSNNNSISNNKCSLNNRYGIYKTYSRYVGGTLMLEIKGIIGSVHLWSSNNNNICNNTCSGNGGGIDLWLSVNNSISNNECSANRDYGVFLGNSSRICVSNNNCTGNWKDGIYLTYANNNSISNNNYSNNRKYGINISRSNNNNIYLSNFINNADNVYSYNSTNFWNSTEKIAYIYNGSQCTNYLGNYWDDYKGKYPCAGEIDSTGIWDTPYRINSDEDTYSLMQPWQNYFPEENEAKENTNQKLAFSPYYQPINISVNLSVPPYPLPLNLSNITNIEKINAEFGLSERGKELLKNNGFVIIDYERRDDIVAPYEDMKRRDIPIFVTTDTLLHLYHIQFNEILKGIEEREFFDELVDMSNAMLEQSIQDYENFTDPEMKEAARRNVAYFAVALKLLQTPTEEYDEERLKREIEEWNTKYPWDKKTFKPIKKVEFEIPDYVKEDVDKEIENIEQHDGFHPSVIFNSNPNCICDYPCCYCEDYSQYVPRGHYTRSEKLKRYFNAMMWYGRMAFFLKGGDDALISEQDAKISTIQAALISSEQPDVKVGNKTAQEIWNRIYSVTAFFVGTADDLTPYEYQDALNNVFGAKFNASELSNEDKLLALEVELARLRSPEIYGGSGVCVVLPPITKEKLYKCLNKTKGMRFMGQRFVPDSYMFDQLVSPAVGMYVGNDTPFTMCITDAGRARCFPRGLDIMAVLGSERAEDILIEEGDTEYAGINTSYDKQLEELKSQFAGFNFNITEWNRNLYWSWLYTLKPLLKPFGDGYPTFMQTRAWQEKELQTSLASWTELRHDTILYAKQSYTPPLLSMPPQPKPVVGYVEPVPEFYARLLALTEMTENGLIDLDVLNETEKARLQRLERILERLINISKAELENKELTENDYKFIRNFGERLDYVVAGVDVEGKETTIVADVHTDCNTGKVLEEGVGYVNLILVAYTVPDGRIIVGAGPVFSYYEFKQPMDDRLTDEMWKEMLERNPPEKPEWVRGIEADW